MSWEPKGGSVRQVEITTLDISEMINFSIKRVSVITIGLGLGIMDGLIRNRDGTFELTGTATDEHSRVVRIEVSRNAGDWEPVFPVDGMLDSPEEPFRYVTEVLDAGEHVFVFAATDETEHTGSGKPVVHVDAKP